MTGSETGDAPDLQLHQTLKDVLKMYHAVVAKIEQMKVADPFFEAVVAGIESASEVVESFSDVAENVAENGAEEVKSE